MNETLLYPKNTNTRGLIDLSGMWKFKFDFESKGESLNYKLGLTDTIEMPVPASYNDLFTEKKYKEYTGDVWYEKRFYACSSWKDKEVNIRFYGAIHKATIYINGIEIGTHIGGFTPIMINISEYIEYNKENIIICKLNNELGLDTLPVGETKKIKSGLKMSKPYFDFFNYGGLIRPVKLVILPKESIKDITLVHKVEKDTCITSYYVDAPENLNIRVDVYDENGVYVTEGHGYKNQIIFNNPTLWEPLKPYLYKFVFKLIKNAEIIDEYPLEVGLREVKIDGTEILINNKSIYLKGFGKHEDSIINGRGENLAVIKRDFELMKWIGANSFRTSHYPYSEEIYNLADKEGFLIIDEVAAVGMMKSLMNALDAASTNKKEDPYFDEKIVFEKTVKNHLNAIEELIRRDKNHPSVIAWSLLNEPDTVSSEKAVEYFEKLFNFAHEQDLQNRPCSFAHLMNSLPDKCKCTHLTDFVMLNRYYGWYLKGGYEIDEAIDMLDEELKGWERFNKPVIFSEYGADTLLELSKLPSIMWSVQYQVEYLEKNHKIFDKYSFVKGEQVWNFADFETSEGIIRAGGNKKGIFTRDRQPKMAAYYLKKRWEELPLNYKATN